VQIKKTYRNLKPNLLYDEIKDLVLKQGLVVKDTMTGSYAMPDDTSSFITRGTVIFRTPGKSGEECLNVNVVGSEKTESRVIFDINEALFAKDKVEAIVSDLDFLLGSYEVKPD
jgi:hypothetical protein